jgi:hypothetical protein
MPESICSEHRAVIRSTDISELVLFGYSQYSLQAPPRSFRSMHARKLHGPNVQ